MQTQSIQIKTYPDGRLDAKNAALYLGLSEKTLATMRCNGTGPAFIKRGRVFYYPDDLQAWLAQSGKYTSTAQARLQKEQADNMRQKPGGESE